MLQLVHRPGHAFGLIRRNHPVKKSHGIPWLISTKRALEDLSLPYFCSIPPLRKLSVLSALEDFSLVRDCSFWQGSTKPSHTPTSGHIGFHLLLYVILLFFSSFPVCRCLFKIPRVDLCFSPDISANPPHLTWNVLRQLNSVVETQSTMASYEKGGDPELAKTNYEYDNNDVTLEKEGTTTDLPGEQLHRGLHSRQVSMIAIGT